MHGHFARGLALALLVGIGSGCGRSPSSPNRDTTGSTGGPSGSGSGGSTGGSGGGANLPPTDSHIVVDQLGYRPSAEKIAVVRNPKTGFDAANAFTPGSSYALVNVATGARVLEAAPSPWNGGAVDAS